ncbi:MAG: phosphatase PAP2 family protein [Sphaerochaetaceae bacterium]
MKKIIVLCIVILFVAFPLTALMVSPYAISWLVDGVLGSAGILTAGGGVIAGHVVSCSHAYTGRLLRKDDVNAFDRWAMRPYNETMDKVSKILEIAGFATLGILLTIPVKEWTKAGAIGMETFLLSYGSKQLAKAFVQRARPYMYFSGYPLEAIRSGDWNRSFFSGHTTYAFAIAGLVSSMFRAYHPKSGWNIPVTAGCYALATAMGMSRILSGNHFLSDVLIAAAIGTVIGIFVPRFHMAKGGSSADGTLLGNTMMVSFVF